MNDFLLVWPPETFLSSSSLSSALPWRIFWAAPLLGAAFFGGVVLVVLGIQPSWAESVTGSVPRLASVATPLFRVHLSRHCRKPTRQLFDAGEPLARLLTAG